MGVRTFVNTKLTPQAKDNGWYKRTNASTTFVILSGPYTGLWVFLPRRADKPHDILKYHLSPGPTADPTKQGDLFEWQEKQIEAACEWLQPLNDVVRSRWIHSLVNITGVNGETVLAHLTKYPDAIKDLERLYRLTSILSGFREKVRAAKRFFKRWSVNDAAPTKLKRWKGWEDCLRADRNTLAIRKISDLEHIPHHHPAGLRTCVTFRRRWLHAQGDPCELPGLFKALKTQEDFTHIHDSIRIVKRWRAELGLFPEATNLVRAYDRKQWKRLANYHNRLVALEKRIQDRLSVLQNLAYRKHHMGNPLPDVTEGRVRIRWLKTREAFRIEGKKMSHCIYGYWSINRLYCAAVTISGFRCSVAVYKETMEIQQVHGPRNSHVDPAFRTVLQDFLDKLHDTYE